MAELPFPTEKKPEPPKKSGGLFAAKPKVPPIDLNKKIF